MKLHEMTYTEGARKASYRVGRGHASGNGKTCLLYTSSAQQFVVLL